MRFIDKFIYIFIDILRIHPFTFYLLNLLFKFYFALDANIKVKLNVAKKMYDIDRWKWFLYVQRNAILVDILNAYCMGVVIIIIHTNIISVVLV